MTLSKVKDYMTTGVITIDSSSTVKQACEKMREAGVSGLFVTSQDGEVGVFTDTDLLRLLSEGKSVNTELKEVMSREIYSVSPEASLEEAAKLIRKNRVSRLFVFSGNPSDEKPKGIISVTDIIRALRDRLSFK